MGRKQRRGASRIARIAGGGAAPSPRAPHPFFFKHPTLPLLGSRRRRRQPQPQQPQTQPQPAPQPPQPQQLLKDRWIDRQRNNRDRNRKQQQQQQLLLQQLQLTTYNKNNKNNKNKVTKPIYSTIIEKSPPPADEQR